MARILVIENEESLRTLLLDLLESEEFDVIAAENGAIGIRRAEEFLPDLVLCDVMMPGLNGFAVLERLRQNPKTAGIPLIFLTARTANADLRQGMRLGADDYITKPFSRKELLEAIATRLAKYAAITQPYVEALEQATAELNDALNYDRATRLPTRLLLQDKFDQLCMEIGSASLKNASLTPDPAAQPVVSVLSLSIDRFDQLCNRLESAEEEIVLQTIAQRLLACVSQQDTVARLSEEQFAILLTNGGDRSIVHSTCQQLLELLAQALLLDDQEVFLTVSIGVALYPQDGIELNDLMHKANVALRYVQKRSGNQYQFYTTGINGNNSDRLALESSLRRAIERDEFQVYYQPQVDLQTGGILGAEALVRWQNPDRGMVSPLEFIPLAEETGLIRPIGEWVLHTACQQTQAWRSSQFQALRIAVNLSAQQFIQPQLGQTIAQTLQTTGLDPTALELELTESTLLQNETEAIATLDELKAQGVQIAIDDFGTGYASLSYLKQFPFDSLKIDRCFIRNVHSESYNNAITTAVLQIAQRLNLNVVAEGVETEAELAFLRIHHCQAMQGFLFSRPLPANEFETLLLSGKSLPA